MSLKENFTELFICPKCKGQLRQEGTDSLVCSNGHRHPIVRGIPRFVPSDSYVDSFSFEWNTHNTTQLDSRRGDSSSEEMFIQKTGLSPDQVRGKLVLDAGVGAGRFCDILARWGAKVVGVDLSLAVEASHKNFKDNPDVVIAQADIGSLPFRPETFDFIVSIGVLHHTPDTRKHFEALVPLLKKNGSICIWVYPKEQSYVTRSKWIPFTSRIPDWMYYEWCRWFVPLVTRNMNTSLARWIYQVFPFSNQGLGLENDILDTFDGYSPTYHGVHSPQEVEEWFRSAGLVDVCQPSGWETSVRGVRQ